MARPDPIQYAERLYGAIRAANFSPISFLAFGNAIEDGVSMRNMSRIAAEPFMRVVGERLDLEAGDDDEIVDAPIVSEPAHLFEGITSAASSEPVAVEPLAPAIREVPTAPSSSSAVEKPRGRR